MKHMLTMVFVLSLLVLEVQDANAFASSLYPFPKDLVPAACKYVDSAGYIEIDSFDGITPDDSLVQVGNVGGCIKRVHVELEKSKYVILAIGRKGIGCVENPNVPIAYKAVYTASGGVICGQS